MSLRAIDIPKDNHMDLHVQLSLDPQHGPQHGPGQIDCSPQASAATTPQSGYVTGADGVSIHYEVHGLEEGW